MFYYFSQRNLDYITLLNFKRFSFILLIILIPLAIYMGYNGGISRFTGYNEYFNRVIFKLMLPLSFFLVASMKRKYLVWIPLAMVYLYMIERTSALITMLIIASFYLLPKIARSHKQTNRIFWIIIGLLFLFIGGYVWLWTTDVGREINEWIFDISNKQLFSGRQIIWSSAFKAFLKKPVLGYGFNPDVLQKYGVELSPHNAYIYILLQTGSVGLMLFLSFLYTIWQNLATRTTDLSRLSLSYLLALLVFMNFELTLVANSMVLGLYYTLTIAIGSYYRENTSYN